MSGFFRSIFFVKKHLTSAARCGIIEGGQRAGEGRPGPIFRSVYPICKFFATSSDPPYAPDFPVKWAPIGNRPVRTYAAQKLIKPIGSIPNDYFNWGRSALLLFSSIIIISYFFKYVKPIGNFRTDRYICLFLIL